MRITLRDHYGRPRELSLSDNETYLKKLHDDFVLEGDTRREAYLKVQAHPSLTETQRTIINRRTFYYWLVHNQIFRW